MTNADAELIRRSLAGPTKACLDRFEAFAEIDSTNTFLKKQASPARGHFHVAIAGHQTAGRGSAERQWVSVPGSSLCLSMSYSFRQAPEILPAVTLALGVGIAKALTTLGIDGIELKWPNDLLIGNAKLGGMLTETQVRDRKAISVVAGIGINVGLSETIAGRAESDWPRAPVGLASVMRDPPGVEQLAAVVIDAMFDTFITYDEHGFKFFNADFTKLDWLAGKRVVVEGADGRIRGTAKGIDSTGALLVDRDGTMLKILSGSILLAEDHKAPV